MRWSGLLGWLGAVAIIFGLISLFLQMATGGLFLARDLPWIWANFGIGIVLSVIAVFTNSDTLRERLGTGGAKRAGKYGASAFAGAVLGITLLSLLAFLSTRYHARWDWSEAKLHTLSSQAENVLRGLDEDVVFTGFFTSINEPAVRRILDRFEYQSDRVKIEFVDPQVNPGRSRGLGIADEKLAAGLLHIQLGEQSTELEELSEETITNALVKLTRQDVRRVYFLEGHGERATKEEAAEEGEGFAQALDALRNENYQVEDLLLAATGSVPDDADVLVVAGPTRPLHDIEHQALAEYIQRGGALLVMLDPRAQTDLYNTLEGFGVKVGEDVVVDRVQGLFGRPVSPFAAQYADHVITEPLRERTLFHMARSVRPKDPQDTNWTRLVMTGDESWGEVDLDTFFDEGTATLEEGDLRGPVSIAVAGEIEAAPDSEDKARIVVFGDSDFASNVLLRQHRNRDLFVNAVNWLLGDVEAISIRPATARASRLALNTEEFMRLRLLSLFVLPEIIAIIGVFVWWWRRREPAQ
jgi:ABC-type uncharacterized transport system involved in gliding motility auxiliary subunit